MRIVLTIAFLLVAVSTQAATLTPVVRRGAALTCSPSIPANDNDEVGNLTQETNDEDISKTRTGCFLATAECTGTLAVGYAYHYNTDSTTAKIAIYSDDGDSTPDAGDLKIAYSATMTSTAAEWKTDGGTIGGAVTATNAYWVCLAVDDLSTTNWRTTGANTGSWFHIGNDFYTNEPADLTGAWTEVPAAAGTGGPLSIFVGIE